MIFDDISPLNSSHFREVIDMERNLERVGCNISTFPAPESTIIANPIAIAQSVALLLGATNPMLSRFDVSGNTYGNA